MASFRFGHGTVDLDARQVLRAGQPVHVSLKAFELLRILITERPRALSKSELHERIWPGTFVTDDSLAGLVAEARRAIGDRGRNPEFLRTIHGFGYAFAAVPEQPDRSTVSATQPACWLVVDKRAIPLTEGANIIGREATAQVVMDSTRVSRQHASITVNGSMALLEDLGSRNGTSVNGVPVTAPVALTDGATIAVGGMALTFRASADAPQTEADE
jgi:DNA-binding winged helix-turn-helix (wHTH) protein